MAAVKRDKKDRFRFAISNGYHLHGDVREGIGLMRRTLAAA